MYAFKKICIFYSLNFTENKNFTIFEENQELNNEGLNKRGLNNEGKTTLF